MKFNVVEVTFKTANSRIGGGSMWASEIKQGGYDSCEYDTELGLLTFETKLPGVKKRRVHVSNTVDMVFGATVASKLPAK